ncbi:MAG TPA: response regulator transcription factor [Candidatus Anaerostipes avistercoris]|uniref:Stage 0 sporulation protein A homolog n=1 Tax=Candidatus Anaerostipes avistercoris TaxID=2838462 RepID=A0A9D2T940_9FIRM|nr:response regulator transcription factor [Candidatus Anaerostipes avistercoris]
MTIMIVEDEKLLSGEIREFLTRWGYRAVSCTDFEDIFGEFQKIKPHLVLMDINLPYYDGYHWCRKIREISHVPILYISSRNDDRDKIMGIAQGGDDYIEKPFHLELLKAKIEASLRRTYQYQVKDRVPIGEHLMFDQNSLTVFYGEQEVELTRSEQKIMEKLIEMRPGVVTRDELMMVLWNTDEFVSDGTLTTMVSRLRKKLEQVSGDKVIKTRKGTGYYIQ